MLLSILTVTLRADSGVHATAESIESDPRVEWIVKDSNVEFDKTLVPLVGLPNVRVVSAKDESIYEGLNQTLKLANGLYFMVLGAGDRIVESAISEILRVIEANESELGCDSIFFAIKRIDNGLIIEPNIDQLPNRMSVPHPAVLLKTEKVVKLGGFDECYRIAADYDMVCRYLKRWPKAMISRRVIVDFKGGGLSEVNREEAYFETELVRLRNFPKM
jgi:glycosyltransferase